MLVQFSRDTIEKFVTESKKIKPRKDLENHFSMKMGVFVTIHLKTPKNSILRGCIGHLYTKKSFIESLIDSSISAAAYDPRFEQVSTQELNKIIIEVSFLSNPELIHVNSPQEYIEKIKIGRDGLIVEWAYGSGLLLPQVALENEWTAEEFLSHTCAKAGAPENLWLTKEVDIYRFSAIIFGEKSPRGPVVRKSM